MIWILCQLIHLAILSKRYSPSASINGLNQVIILGWPKHSFRFFHFSKMETGFSYAKTRTNILANPVIRITNLRMCQALFWNSDNGSNLGTIILPMKRKGTSRKVCVMEGKAAMPSTIIIGRSLFIYFLKYSWFKILY